MNTPEAPKSPEQPWWQPAVFLFIKMSAWIAGPVILATFLGRWLDRRYHTEPWLFISTVGIAFLLSMVVLVKTVVEEYGKIENERKVGSIGKTGKTGKD